MNGTTKDASALKRENKLAGMLREVTYFATAAQEAIAIYEDTEKGKMLMELATLSLQRFGDETSIDYYKKEFGFDEMD